MKKIFTLILIFAILIIPFSPLVAFAEGEDSGGEKAKFISSSVFLEKFVTAHPNRLAGTEKERAAAEFIAGEFVDWGYEPFNENAENEERFYQEFSFTYNGVKKYSQNVIATKPAKTQDAAKTVIIGAHYDNWYMPPEGVDENDYKMQGAYDNGTGVAVMMDLAYRLKDIDSLNFNITFIAFGAEEYGMFGSEWYADKLTEKKLENTLIMFNLDAIGAGDKLYLYCDEVKTEHESFLLDTAEKLNEIRNLKIELNSPPLDKHTVVFEFNGMPYFHQGLASDHLPFLTRRVNCAFFFTYNWEYGLSESDKNPTMLHNTNDNLKFLDEHYAETYKKFMADVSDIVYASLNAESFTEKMVSSFNNKFDYRPFINKTTILITGIVILTLAAILVILTYYFLNKNKSKKQPEILTDVFKEEKDLTVFGKDFEDDIFS